MKLQLAIDLLDIPEAVELAGQVKEYIDIVEIGTPVINRKGHEAVRKMKEAHPDLEVLADVKIMDAASYEVQQASEAGADIVTILGVAEDASIKGAVEEAKKQGKELLVDMIGVQDIEKRAKELDEFGADYIAVHTGYDLQAEGKDSFKDLATIKSVIKNSKTAIAGGIKLETVEEVIKQAPDLVIVGGGIANADDPKEAAKTIHEKIQQG